MPQFNGLNYLTQNRATLQISGLEDVEFSITSFNLPSLTLEYSDVATPYWHVREATTKPEFGQLEIQFVVDEELKNWLSIYNWLMDLSFRRTAVNRSTDGTIIIYNSNNNPIVKFGLVGVIPVFVSDITFQESTGEATPIIASARFMMTYYDVIS